LNFLKERNRGIIYIEYKEAFDRSNYDTNTLNKNQQHFTIIFIGDNQNFKTRRKQNFSQTDFCSRAVFQSRIG
jgi:hypothetical protein